MARRQRSRNRRAKTRTTRPGDVVLARRHVRRHDRGVPSRRRPAQIRPCPPGGAAAEELAIPRSLIISRVSLRYSIRSSRICHTSPVVIHGIVQSIHHSGCSRLGVWPLPSRARRVSLTSAQWLGILVSHVRVLNLLGPARAPGHASDRDRASLIGETIHEIEIPRGEGVDPRRLGIEVVGDGVLGIKRGAGTSIPPTASCLSPNRVTPVAATSSCARAAKRTAMPIAGSAVDDIRSGRAIARW